MTPPQTPPEQRLPEAACSRSWEASGHPVWGTAAVAGFWVALEQPGPWGVDAFTESWLDPQLGPRLQRTVQEAGGRLVLVRAVDDRRRREEMQVRRLFVAGDLGGDAGGPWLVAATLDDPEDMLRLPLHSLAHGPVQLALDALPGSEACADGMLLVCTNGKRDVCCAVRGRPVAVAADARRPGRVWECTHTGGHRFAATGIALPTGHTVARLTPELAVEIVDAEAGRRLAAGALGAARDRGRSHLPLPRQAAEAWVRARTGETSLGALRSRVDAGDAWDAQVTVVHEDGRAWPLHVHKEQTGDARVNSCGEGPRPAVAFRVDPRP